MKIDHSEALRENYPLGKPWIPFRQSAMESTVLSEDEIFQDEEQAMSAISHLLVNQHKGRIKGEFVLGAREHTGFPIFATYFGF